MTWTTLSYTYGSLLTSAKMTQLYDNLTALADGDSGAPPIKTASFEPPTNGNNVCHHASKAFMFPQGSTLSITTSAGQTLVELRCRKTGTYKVAAGGDNVFFYSTAAGAEQSPALRVLVNGSGVGSDAWCDTSSISTFDVYSSGVQRYKKTCGYLETTASIAINSGDTVGLLCHVASKSGAIYQVLGGEFHLALASAEPFGLFNFDVRSIQNYPS